MKKNTMAIVHFNPIELYPPVMNLLDYLAKQKPLLKVYVFTNASDESREEYQSRRENVQIHRFAVIGPEFSPIRRYRNYFKFYYKSYQNLNNIKPEWVWYFETASALPVKWYFNGSKSIGSKLLIHYHEYMSPAEYQQGPGMVQWIHRKEKKLYDLAYSVSHTNNERMQMFLKDNQLSLAGKTKILPNYPPRGWIKEIRENRRNGPLKIVYVGVIGMETLYIREFCEWVEGQEGKVVFDIYSQQQTGELENWIRAKSY